jgi:NTE family protein
MKIGLALAGGGVKGAGHIGVIKALQENGIEIGYIGGTSIGSIVTSLYAMGYSTDEMLKLFKYFAKDIMKVDPKYYWTNVKSRKNFMGYGLISGENIEMAINECAEIKGIKKMTDIKIPIVMPTVDIKENKKYVFTNHEYDDKFKEDTYIRNATVGKAARASSSYPGVFAPTILGTHKFVDGGIIDNLPAQEVRKLGAEKVLSVRFSSEKNSDPKNLVEVAIKSVDLMFDQRTAAEIASSDYSITLDLAEASVFNIKKIDYCYEQGYITAMKNMAQIKEIFN